MPTFDVRGLHTALDAQRTAAGLTWRQVAHQAGVSPSTLTRLGQGRHPDMTSFAELLGWLGLTADTFIVRADSETPRPPEPLAAAAAILRGDPRLSRHAATAITKTLTAMYEAVADDKPEPARGRRNGKR